MSVGPFLACGAARVKIAANPARQPGQPLVLAHVVVRGKWGGVEVGGPATCVCRHDAPRSRSGRTTHRRLGQRRRAGRCAGRTKSPHCAVRVDRDRGLERERAHTRERRRCSGATAVARLGHADAAELAEDCFERDVDGAVRGDRRAGKPRLWRGMPVSGSTNRRGSGRCGPSCRADSQVRPRPAIVRRSEPAEPGLEVGPRRNTVSRFPSGSTRTGVPDPRRAGPAGRLGLGATTCARRRSCARTPGSWLLGSCSAKLAQTM